MRLSSSPSLDHSRTVDQRENQLVELCLVILSHLPPTYLLQNAVYLVVEMILRSQVDSFALVQFLLVLIKRIVFENIDVRRNSSDHLVVYVDALQLKLQTFLVFG